MVALPERCEPAFEELSPPLTYAEAIVEADRCLECGGRHAEAPCVVCPTDAIAMVGDDAA